MSGFSVFTRIINFERRINHMRFAEGHTDCFWKKRMELFPKKGVIEAKNREEMRKARCIIY